MARHQSLDLGLTLGLGLAPHHQPHSFFSNSGDVDDVFAAEYNVQEPSRLAAAEEGTCSLGSPTSSGSGNNNNNSNKRSAADRTSSGSGDEVDDDGSARKKLRLSKDQAAVLEECFKTHHTLTPKQKVALAKSLSLRPRQVEVWFQNRRARTKLKQTEVDCEYLKRWCEQLADDNRRLEKEVAELRALKAAAPPQAPLTTLTMCLSCKRVASACNGGGATPASFSAAAGAGMASPVAMLPGGGGHRKFFCGFRDTGAAAYGSSSGLAKAAR